MSIFVNGLEKEFRNGIRPIDLLPIQDKTFFSCKINNKLRDLFYPIEDNNNIEFLALNDEDSIRIYESSLRYVLAMSIKRCFPNLKFSFDYYISRSISCHSKDKIFNNDDLEKIKKEMSKIIESNYTFVRKTITPEEADEYYSKNGFEDKVHIYAFRPKKEVYIYECDDYANYMYSYMVPSTGYLKKYNLLLYKGMIILQYPRFEENGEIPKFVEESTYEQTLLSTNDWGEKIGALTVSDINENILKNPKEFIEKCEQRHTNLIHELGEKISKRDIKLIAIAGPSSSGKTTFSNKLRIELERRGLHPVKLSMDDYYKDRSNLTKEEEENIDFEDINLLDIELFNKHIKELVDGKEVTLPKFEFVTKKRIVGSTIKLGENSPIIIEGIHALNKKLTSSISKENKFEIYIGPHIQINLDDYNPISVTHLRLIRRIVRDNRCRGADVSQTLEMWESVRKGEFKWIYDNQEGVDFVYNSVLNYEFCVMKKYALPLLNAVPETSSEYNLAKTLIKYLKYFVDVDDKYVPEDSLIREFIGGSCFKD